MTTDADEANTASAARKAALIAAAAPTLGASLAFAIALVFSASRAYDDEITAMGTWRYAWSFFGLIVCAATAALPAPPARPRGASFTIGNVGRAGFAPGGSVARGHARGGGGRYFGCGPPLRVARGRRRRRRGVARRPNSGARWPQRPTSAPCRSGLRLAPSRCAARPRATIDEQMPRRPNAAVGSSGSRFRHLRVRAAMAPSQLDGEQRPSSASRPRGVARLA